MDNSHPNRVHNRRTKIFHNVEATCAKEVVAKEKEKYNEKEFRNRMDTISLLDIVPK